MSELKIGLENELSNVKMWLNKNKLTLNTDKTEVIFFGTKRKLKSFKDVSINYNNIPLKSKDKVKYLGVTFENTMSWKKHIKNLVHKSYFKLRKIRSVNSSLTDEIRHLLVNSTVMPYLHYCSPAWSNASKSVLKPAEKLYDNINKFLGKSEQSLTNLLNFKSAISIFKAAHKLSPIYLSDKIKFVKNSHRTRSSINNMLVTQRSGTKFFNKTFSYSSPILWNNLPNEIRNLESILQFKVATSKFFKLK